MKSDVFQLAALPLGLRLPVVFPIGLQNIGSHSLKYVLDRKKFLAEYPQDAAEGIVDFENTEGTLLAGEKKFLCVLYRPIRETVSRFRLQIRVNDYFKEIQVLDLELSGRGGVGEPWDSAKFFKVDDKIETDKAVLAESDRVAYFSEELLDFRGIDFGLTHKRVLFLYNNSAREKFEFRFMHHQTTRSGKKSRRVQHRARKGRVAAEGAAAGGLLADPARPAELLGGRDRLPRQLEGRARDPGQPHRPQPLPRPAAHPLRRKPHRTGREPGRYAFPADQEVLEY